jgi:hypothetical protein
MEMINALAVLKDCFYFIDKTAEDVFHAGIGTDFLLGMY